MHGKRIAKNFFWGDVRVYADYLVGKESFAGCGSCKFYKWVPAS